MAKRYYWLKLKEDFFRNKIIKKLRKVAGGDTYVIIYLKLQLLSLKNEGVLIFDGLEETFAKELSLEIDEDEVDIDFLLFFLKQAQAMEEFNDNEFTLLHTVEMIGSEGASAERVREFRERKNQERIGTTKKDPVTNTLRNVTITFELLNSNYEKDYIFNLREIKTMKLFSDIEVNDLFESLLIQRTKLKNKAINSRTAIKTIYNKLKPLGNTDRITLLNKALESGWKTVYTDNKDSKQSRQDIKDIKDDYITYIPDEEANNGPFKVGKN